MKLDWEEFPGIGQSLQSVIVGVLLRLQVAGHGRSWWFLCQSDQRRVQKRRQRPDNDHAVSVSIHRAFPNREKISSALGFRSHRV